MRRRGFLVTAVAAVAVTVGAWLTPSAGATTQTSRLVGIRAAHHPGFDRVVFDFRGPVPYERSVRYVSSLIADGSGARVSVAGRAFLRVRFAPAEAHDATGATAPARVAYPLPNVLTVVRAGDFEGVVSYGIGLAARQRLRLFALTNPSRVVLDIRSDFPTAPRSVYFLDEKRFVAGTEPYVRPVPRPVRLAAPATGVLDRFFAGPTPSEYAAGLRLVRSGATGSADLRVRNGIARLRLTGGCNAGGSTFSIADEILPTLKQLASIDYVKIYDPAGRTADPTGTNDSIPDCLNP
jgi:hypothetical protein